MNRRNFFKAVTGFVAGVFATSVKGRTIRKPKSGPPGPTTTTMGYTDMFQNSWDKARKETTEEFMERLRIEAAEKAANPPIVINNDDWTFYINGKEVDNKRAIDELGALYFPFQGAKKEDVCAIKSSMLQFKIV